jgi:hypothetical protein
MPCIAYKGRVNFKLIQYQPIPISSLEIFPNSVAARVGAVEAPLLMTYYDALPKRILLPTSTTSVALLEVLSIVVNGAEIQFVVSDTLVPSQGVPKFPTAPISLGCDFTFSLPTLYKASVDEIQDQSGDREGDLDNYTISLEGRWVGKPPNLVRLSQHNAALLTEGSTWTSGTFKTIPRLLSRLNGEQWLGAPLLGKFNFNSLVLNGDLQTTSDVANNLTTSDYPNFL